MVAATSEEQFLNDEVLPAAVLHHLTVVGEAIGRLSAELKGRHPEVPWRQIVAVRHRIVHAYFDLDWKICGMPRSGKYPSSAVRSWASSQRSSRMAEPSGKYGTRRCSQRLGSRFRGRPVE